MPRLVGHDVSFCCQFTEEVTACMNYFPHQKDVEGKVFVCLSPVLSL